MVILSALQPHRLLAAPPQPLPQYTCSAEGGSMDGSQHGMPYSMSLDDMRSQVAGEEDRCGRPAGGAGKGLRVGCRCFEGAVDWCGCRRIRCCFKAGCPKGIPTACCYSSPPPASHLLPRPAARSPYGELRCVLAVIRHGDRTPKQKMKMKVTQEPLLALLHKYLDSKGKQAKLKVGVWGCGGAGQGRRWGALGQGQVELGGRRGAK